MNFNIDKILSEWAYRVDDGQPDVSNPDHIENLREILYHFGLPHKFIVEYVHGLTEKRKPGQTWQTKSGTWAGWKAGEERAQYGMKTGKEAKAYVAGKTTATSTDSKETDKKTTPTPTKKKKNKYPKTASGPEWLGDDGTPLDDETIIKNVSTKKQAGVVQTQGSRDVQLRASESRKKAFGGKAGKGGGDTTIQEEMTNMGREITLDPKNKDLTKEALAEKIAEKVLAEHSDSDVANDPARLKRLTEASVAAFDTAKDLQTDEQFRYNSTQPEGYPVNTTDSQVVRDTLATQLLNAKTPEEKAHAKLELAAFQKHAGDKSITGKEGDADTMIIYQDTNGRDRIAYVTNKQTLNDQQSSGTINSAKRALNDAADSQNLTDQERSDVKEIAQNQFDESNAFDKTMATSINRVANNPEYTERLETEQSQTTFAKASAAMSGKAKNGYPFDEMTPEEKVAKRKYIEKNKTMPEVQAKLLKMEPAPEGKSHKSDEYKVWAANIKKEYDNKEREFTDGEVCYAASQVTGVGRLKKGSQVRTNEKALIVTRDIHTKMQKYMEQGRSVEEAAKQLKEDFDKNDKGLVGKSKPGKPDKKMYGGVFDESDFIEIATNPVYREMEKAERQRGKDIANMQTKTVKNLYNKDKESWEAENPGKEYPAPPPNGKRVQAYVKGYMNRVHLSGYVSGKEDGRKFAEMGQTSITPREMRQALANITNYEGDVNNYEGLEKHLLENIQVYDPKNENSPFEMWYVYEDKTTGKTERRHIGTDTHRTGGDASKVAGQHGSDLQEGLKDVQPKRDE